MKQNYISLTLRIALAFSFLYPGVAGFISPENWIGYFPPFLLTIIPEMTLLVLFEVFEIILALWILSGWKLFYSSLIAFVMLLAIVLLNISQMDVLFRDLSIAGIALALILISFQKTPLERLK